MRQFCKFLFFGLFFCASAFSQEIGIIQCDSEEMTSVPAWMAPGKPQVIEQLSCGQMVSVIDVGSYVAPAQYSSRPSRYAQIQIGESVAYVDAKYVKIPESQEGLKVIRDQNMAAARVPTKEEEEQKKWDLIKKDEISFRDEKLLDPMYAGGPRTFTATLSNKSSFAVSHLRLLVRLYDCSGRPDSDYSNCEIIGEVRPVISAPVPAGQTREIVSSMLFEATPRVKGRFAWGYNILGVRGE
jgi:hypothetical protein